MVCIHFTFLVQIKYKSEITKVFQMLFFMCIGRYRAETGENITSTREQARLEVTAMQDVRTIGNLFFSVSPQSILFRQQQHPNGLPN